MEWTKDTSTRKSTRIIKIRNVSSDASYCQKGENTIQNQIQKSDSTSDNTNNKVASEERGENGPQNRLSDVMTLSDGNFYYTEEKRGICEREILSELINTLPPKRPKAFLLDDKLSEMTNDDDHPAEGCEDMTN
jgi:hypothetical protein